MEGVTIWGTRRPLGPPRCQKRPPPPSDEVTTSYVVGPYAQCKNKSNVIKISILILPGFHIFFLLAPRRLTQLNAGRIPVGRIMNFIK